MREVWQKGWPFIVAILLIVPSLFWVIYQRINLDVERELDEQRMAMVDGMGFEDFPKEGRFIRTFLDNRHDRVVERRKLILDRHPLIRTIFRIGDFFGAIVGWMQMPNKFCLFVTFTLPALFVLLLLIMFIKIIFR